MNTIFRDRVGQSILFVTHGGILRTFRFLLEHWDYERAPDAGGASSYASPALVAGVERTYYFLA